MNLFDVVQGVYTTRVSRGANSVTQRNLNVITDEARELIALAMFDGATTPTSWQIGLIGREHIAFGAPTDTITDSLGPPYLTSNPILNDIFSVSGIKISASAVYSDLGTSTLPTLDALFPRTSWLKNAPTLTDEGAFSVPAAAFQSYSITEDCAVYGFYICASDGSLLLSVAPFSWVRAAPRYPFGTRPNGGGGFGDIQWNTGTGPLIAGDTLEVAYSLGTKV